jgi:hypothetical protein
MIFKGNHGQAKAPQCYVSTLPILFLLQMVQTGFGAQTTMNSMGNGALSRWIKGLVRDVHGAPPSSVEVKNKWSYTSIPPLCFHTPLLKHYKS